MHNNGWTFSQTLNLWFEQREALKRFKEANQKRGNYNDYYTRLKERERYLQIMSKELDKFFESKDK